MYKSNKNNYAIICFIKLFACWLKSKFILILVAFMVGLSNGMYEEDIMIFDNQNKIEQEQKDKNDDIFE